MGSVGDSAHRAIPGYAFTIEAYDLEQMRAAVAARNVDFVLTNPGDYVLMQHVAASPRRSPR